LNDRYYALTGVLGPIIAIICIVVAISLSPWFSWESNALSDLGHSVNSEVAPIFNFGLLLSGFFIVIYSLTSFSKVSKYTYCLLVIVGLALQLVATFNEVYRFLHFQVSVLFFAALGLASISYIIEKKSILAVGALIFGSISWILYALEIYKAGIAVPETISTIATATWVVISALRIYFQSNKREDEF
jgi:hypothetical membrane protein